ncbi:spermidine synthase, partial [Streptomyces coryli]|uniref:spermine/spermidine synthase domain-containing protein n=1 Tax=Streptomyces coryli TaxID=1128680 RepID=UPI003B8378FF
MIDPHEPAVQAAGGGAPPSPVMRLPVQPATGRFLVLVTVFICAACGLIYELELVALASYLVGDSVTQASLVLSIMVFAMGLGALAAKRLRIRAAVGFGAVEAVLGMVGGLSAMALYACFAWLGQPRVALVGFSLAIGVLIGAEVPLLMTLIQRIRRQDPGGAVADLFAADYVGALIGGLAFPFVLLPWLGELTSALLTGAVNAAVGGALVLWLFRYDLSPRARWGLFAGNAAVLALLAAATILTAPFERAARTAVYGDDVRVAVRAGGSETVITGGIGEAKTERDGPLSLYADGRLRASSSPADAYQPGLVGPALAGTAHPAARVLVLGGGDGLVARELLRAPGVRSVTLVEPSAEVLRLARTNAGLKELNDRVHGDPRVRAVRAEPFDWLRHEARPGRYDVVLSDLPDPGGEETAKDYSQEFYGLAARALAPGGRLGVRVGALAERGRAERHDYWTVVASVRSTGLDVVPYQYRADKQWWGLVLAGRGGAIDFPRTDTPRDRLRPLAQH